MQHARVWQLAVEIVYGVKGHSIRVAQPLPDGRIETRKQLLGIVGDFEGFVAGGILGVVFLVGHAQVWSVGQGVAPPVWVAVKIKVLFCAALVPAVNKGQELFRTVHRQRRLSMDHRLRSGGDRRGDAVLPRALPRRTYYPRLVSIG